MWLATAAFCSDCKGVRAFAAIALAAIAIAIYPVGLFALNAVLLFCARSAICSERPSALSRGVGALDEHNTNRPEIVLDGT